MNKDRVFPKILYDILQDAPSHGLDHIVRWNEPHGTSFKIHDRQRFLEDVLVQYGIRQSQYKSLVRQLNLWGFECVHGGRTNPERGSYKHELFQRDKPELIDSMKRCCHKGKHVRRRTSGSTTSGHSQSLSVQQQQTADQQLVPRQAQEPTVIDDMAMYVSPSFWEDCGGNHESGSSSSSLVPQDAIVCDPGLTSQDLAVLDDDYQNIPVMTREDGIPAAADLAALLEFDDGKKHYVSSAYRVL